MPYPSRYLCNTQALLDMSLQSTDIHVVIMMIDTVHNVILENIQIYVTYDGWIQKPDSGFFEVMDNTAQKDGNTSTGDNTLTVVIAKVRS